MRGKRLSALVVSMLAGSPLLVVNATVAHASSVPWANGTLFVAQSGNYNENGGIVVIPPGGRPYQLNYTGGDSVWDIATDAAGDLYYTDLAAGTLDEYSASGATSTLASGFTYPESVALAPSGSILVGDERGIWTVPAGGGAQTEVDAVGSTTGLATDAAGDIFFAQNAGGIYVLAGGTGSPYSLGGIGGISELNSVRFDSAGDLFAAGYFYDNSYELPIGGTSAETFAAPSGVAWAAMPDGNGGVYTDTESSSGQVADTAAPGDAPVVLDTGLDGPAQMNTWPPQVAPSLPASTVTLSSTAPGTVSAIVPVTLTATVTVPSDATGLVSFDVGARSLGQAPVVGGKATLTTLLPVGTPSITAVYLGDSNAALSVSNSLPFTVSLAPSTTTLSSPNGSSLPQDQAATIDVAIGGAGATADQYTSVSITDNGNPIGDVYLGGSSPDGTATIPLYAGANKLVATYEGDNLLSGSVSQALTIKGVAPYAPMLTAVLKAGTKSGSKWPVTATITLSGPAGSGAPVPSGKVTANHGLTCAKLVKSGSVATTTCTGTLKKGSWSIEFTYAGNSDYEATTGFAYIRLGSGGG